MFKFFQRKKEQDVDISEEKESMASVEFSIDANNQVNIYCDWISDDPVLAKLLAEMLFKINNGFFSGNILDIFKAEIDSNIDSKTFLTKTILEWKVLDDAHKDLGDKPIVQPSSFNNNVKAQQ